MFRRFNGNSIVYALITDVICNYLSILVVGLIVVPIMIKEGIGFDQISTYCYHSNLFLVISYLFFLISKFLSGWILGITARYGLFLNSFVSWMLCSFIGARFYSLPEIKPWIYLTHLLSLFVIYSGSIFGIKSIKKKQLDVTENNTIIICCPNCQSINCANDMVQERIKLIISSVFRITSKVKSDYRCFECDNRWQI